MIPLDLLADNSLGINFLLLILLFTYLFVENTAQKTNQHKYIFLH